MTDGNKLVLALLAVGGIFGFIYFISRPSASNQPIAASQRVSLRPVSQAITQYINEETWEWIDWKGRDRSITVHRKLTQL